MLLRLERAKHRNTSGDDVFHHDPICYKAIERVFECCGFILLEKEMPSPGKPVARYRKQHEQGPVAGDESRHQNGEYGTATNKVKEAAHAVVMLTEVVRIKFSKGGVTSIHGEIPKPEYPVAQAMKGLLEGNP